MSLTNGIRIADKLLEGSLTGAQLTTLLATPANLAAWKMAVSTPRIIKTLAEDANSLTQIIASPTGLSAVCASSTAIGAVLGNNTPAHAFVASSTAMTAVAANPTSKLALFNSDLALKMAVITPSAMTVLRAAAGYSVASMSTGTDLTPRPIYAPNLAGSYILLGYSKNNTTSQGISLLATLRPGSAISPVIAPIINGSSTLGADAYAAIPLVGPFLATPSVPLSCGWYFGMLRCDE